MSKISGIGQKLFRWKKGEKTPKNEWPELVGKVWLRFSLSCSWQHNCTEKYAVFFQGSDHLYHLSTKDLVASNKWIFYLRSRKTVVSMIDWPYMGNKSLLKLREIGKHFYRRLIDKILSVRYFSYLSLMRDRKSIGRIVSYRSWTLNLYPDYFFVIQKIFC